MPGEPLLGRAAEAAAIERVLDGARLVTVTGLPGVGKTAVSLAAAGSAAGNFAEGRVLIRLDALRDETLLPHTVGAALRLPDEFTRSRLDVLVDQLRDRHLLLVLDTCEHLLGACAALVSALLPPCPKMKVLATSREPLRVPGEATVAIRPLRLAEAVELFGQRAAQAGSGSRRSTGPRSPRPACSWTSCRWPSSWQRPSSATRSTRRPRRAISWRS
jgi:predicted ATPase